MKRGAAAAALVLAIGALAGCSSRVTIFVRNVKWNPTDQILTVERCELTEDGWSHADEVDPKSCQEQVYRRAASAQKAGAP